MFAIIEAAGWPIWPLILASVVAVAIIIERAYSLRTQEVAPASLLLETIKSYQERGVTQELVTRLADGSAMGRVFATALKNAHNSREIMKESIEEAGRAVTHELDRFLTSLGTIASMAPLLGLLGTVIGMIEIFGAPDRRRHQSRPARARHLDRAVQHRIRPDRGDPGNDLLPLLPRQGGVPGGRHGAAGDQTGGNRPRRQEVKASHEFS